MSFERQRLELWLWIMILNMAQDLSEKKGAVRNSPAWELIIFRLKKLTSEDSFSIFQQLFSPVILKKERKHRA